MTDIPDQANQGAPNPRFDVETSLYHLVKSIQKNYACMFFIIGSMASLSGILAFDTYVKFQALGISVGHWAFQLHTAFAIAAIMMYCSCWKAFKASKED